MFNEDLNNRYKQNNRTSVSFTHFAIQANISDVQCKLIKQWSEQTQTKA